MSINERTTGRNYEHLPNENGKDTPHSPRALVEQAKIDAIERTSQTPDAIKRVETALDLRFNPYVEENWIIAEQLMLPEYQQFVEETEEFLDAAVGVVVCPDGRIAALALGDPLVVGIHRRLQGLPQTRESTKDGVAVLDDSDLAASVTSTIKNRQRAGKNPELIEYIGPHINSSDPREGCGAFKGKTTLHGHSASLGTKYGGIKDFFEELGDQFYAFNNNVAKVGGVGTTIDLVHDAHSEGFIVGLRDQYNNFNLNMTLLENILKLARDGKILMTELLDGMFKEIIFEKAREKNLEVYIDVKKAHKFAENAILIGTIAREITQQQEAEGFSWIPESIRKDKTPAALRALGYRAVRNVVYRVLGNIRPGYHELVEHPERLISVGTTGAAFNRENIPFVQKTPYGPFSPDEVEGVVKLYNLSEGVLESQGVDLEREGRIIVVTGEFNAALYKDEESAEIEFEKIASTIRNNAAKIRKLFKESVKTGETIVIGCIHEPGTRKLTHIV